MKKITVNITKKILALAAHRTPGNKSQKCPVTLAVKHALPNAGTSILNVYAISGDKSTAIPMPQAGLDFVKQFDMVDGFPEKIMKLDEVSFEIEVPAKIMAKVNSRNVVTEKEFA